MMDSQKNKHPQERKQRGLLHWQMISLYLGIYDVIAVNFAYFFGLWIRFDLRYSSIPKMYLYPFLRFAPFYTIFAIIIFRAVGLYRSVWRFASFTELNRIFIATLITTGFQIVGITLFFQRMPISYYLVGAVMQFCLITLVRFSYRYVKLMRNNRDNSAKAQKNAMIIGAGHAGVIIIRELQNSRELDINPVCLIDDNPNKWGRSLYGVPVVGGRDRILEAVDKYQIDQILVTIPSAAPEERRDILNICQESGCEIKNLPGVYQLTNGEVSFSKMKPVSVEDLLGRETIKVNMTEIYELLKGKVILVTGGGGSIGSELCRQIAAHEPKQLIIFDIYENNAYDIQQELKRRYPHLDLVVLIGSVRDSRRVDMVFKQYRPDYVFHAAAHKHVPLMEDSPNEAIKNNVIGTYKTAYAAMKYGTKRFVLISTDKAVNPTNIMGASKRLCEMVIQSMDAVSREGQFDKLPTLHAHADDFDADSASHSEIKANTADAEALSKIQIGSACNEARTGTQFVAVRFGNVLGSNGSVIPLFKKQIESGGPVTVTHPDIIRYFMTIPEAVSLVLQAGAYAWGGEIFVFDMGEPMKIDSLARNMIRLSGYTPDVDIKVEYTGLRPGEKLYEEKLMASEGLKKTDNELIFIGKPVPFDIREFFGELEELAQASYNNSDHIVEMVEQIVPTFQPVGEHPDGDEKAMKDIA